MSAQAYPLQWPEHIERSRRQEQSQFRTGFDQAKRNVIKSLRSFARVTDRQVTEAVMSSNTDLLTDKPADPGVAVWFKWDGESICIPVDRYRTPAENLQAIHHVLEARITEARHGTLQLVRATFAGFKALPPPDGSKAKRPWWEVLSLDSSDTITPAMIDLAYKHLAKNRHPDHGGSDEAMMELNRARQEALREYES